LKAGTYRQQRIYPKTGDTFIGERGPNGERLAILNGARVLTSFTREGSYYVASGQTQQGQVHGFCDDSHPRCAYPEDLFFDNRPMLHVAALSDVGAGEFYFDYTNDKIYFADDPTGHLVETSVTRAAFEPNSGTNPTNVNVRIVGLVIEKYAIPAQMGAIGDQYGCPGWTVEDNEVRRNHGSGIRTANGGEVRGNFVHHNGQLGIGGQATIVEDNEISYNNTLGFQAGWEAGGSKWSFTQDIAIRNNFSHHNDGPGLWTDGDNIGTLYENNRVEDNRDSGIFHEISYAAVIRNNLVERNGIRVALSAEGGCGRWGYGAGIQISASPDVEVYGNTVTNNARQIVGIMQSRGSGAYGVHSLENFYVHDNVVTATASCVDLYGNDAFTGIVQDIGDSSYFTSRGNRFEKNVYYLGIKKPFAWMNAPKTEIEWKSYGQDVAGTFYRL
jgi:parallel beta-helix repeat protein